MRRRTISLALLAAAVSLAVTLAGAGYIHSASAAAGDQSYPGLSFRLAGCNIEVGTTLPNADGKFICPLAQYTDGNLGKNWSELDLVPHRITIVAGNSAPATQTYSFQIMGDFSQTKSGETHLGYDFIENGFENVSAGCGSASISSPQQIDGTLPADQRVFRTITITGQQANSICVLDLYLRLGIGAHLFAGSSLHSQLLNDNTLNDNIGDTGGIGEKTNSIPTNEIAPQSIAKDMVASRNTDHTWDVVKSSTPASLDFGNVCAPGFANTQGVGITVTWTRNAATPSGDATITTHVYATNPSARAITVDVSDQIYEGLTSSGTTVGAPFPGSLLVPANTAGALVLTHTVVVANASASFSDLATAHYTDQVTGIPVPGSTTATASSAVANGTELNGTATITDTESISGSGYSFKTGLPSPVAGSFTNGYVADTYVAPGPVNWSSGSQPGSGTTTFSKTVKLDPIQDSDGHLVDTASLNGSNGFSTSTAPLDVALTSSATATLTINKTIPNVLTGSETQTFTFHVGGQTATITFAAGETSKSTTVDLPPGNYTVTEDTATGWTTDSDKTVDLTLPDHCTNSVTFNNTIPPASVSAHKVTDPAGGEGGWVFTLTKPDNSTVSGTTDASGNIAASVFGNLTQEGQYTITETAKPGFTQVNAVGCTFTVNFPADSGHAYSCTITNRQDGTLTIVKDTNPTPAGATFPFSSGSPGVDPSFNLDTNPATAGTPDHRVFTFSGALSNYGAKIVTEGATANWSLDHITCVGATDNGSGSTANVVVNPGDNVTCTFFNVKDATLTVVKETQPTNSGTDAFGFTHTGSVVTDFTLDTNGSDPTNSNQASFTFHHGQFGTKSVTEATVPTGWSLVSKSCVGGNDTTPLNPATATVDVQPGDSVTCTYTNVKGASLTIIKDTVPVDSGTDSFPYTGTGTNVSANFSLDTHTAGHETTTFHFGNLQFGSKTVTEGATTGWTFTGASCVGDKPNSTPGTATVTVDIQAGDNVTCTFHNVKDAKLTIKKVTDPANSGADSFPFTSASDGVDPSFSLDTNGGTATPSQTTFTFHSGHFGSKAVTEGATTGWTLTDITCSKGGGAGSTATVNIVAGDDVTCTFSNTKDATITVVKVTSPANSLADTFPYTVSGDGMGSGFSLDTNPASATSDTKLITLHGLDATGTKTVIEGSTTGWSLFSLGCTGGGADTSTSGSTSTIGLDPGENVVCTYTNRSRGTVRVVKTLNGNPLTATDQQFQFELRLGDQLNGSSTPLETLTTNGTNLGTLNFTTPLIPGQVYAICELLTATFGPNFDGYGAYNPTDQANTYLCLNFTITTAQAALTPSVTFNIDNSHSTVGALTIGYWKNHSPAACSKSNGNQQDFLTAALGSGIQLGPYLLTDPCAAVQLLSKNTITGQARPGDAVYSMVAQLVAANLNLNNGSSSCQALTDAITGANALLNQIGFDGKGSYKSLAGVQAAASGFNTTLDKYNNNNLC